MGGGTFINGDPVVLSQYRSLRRRTDRPVPFFGTGVRSPEFWDLQKGWRDSRRDWVEVSAELPVVGVRGPLSKAILEDAGARNVVVSGDPAVLFHSPLGRLSSTSRSERARVGINCGETKLMWGAPDTLEEKMAEVTRALIREKVDVSLFAVCPSDRPCCERVGKAAGLDADRIAPVLCTNEAYSSYLENVDVVIALKLHAAVLAAAANIPFIMLEYRPKCLDFVQSVNWERFTVRTNALGTDHLMELTLGAIADREALREELCRSMCARKEQFLTYCDLLRPLLATPQP
jgi:polysaccharide pyruvyl transferase WcaK-like protein